jgi:hypothetical protein
MGGAPRHPRMPSCPIGSRSNIGACLDGGFGWGLHEIRSSWGCDRANGRTSQRGHLEICLARFLQLSEFKSRAVRSPCGRLIEPIGEMPRGGCVEIHFTALTLLAWTMASNPDGFLIGSLCRASRRNQLPQPNHLHKVTALTGFSHTAASQVNIRYLCGAALRRSRGAGLPDCEKRFERSARSRFSIMRSVTSALCVARRFQAWLRVDGGLAVSSRERSGVEGIVWKVDLE